MSGDLGTEFENLSLGRVNLDGGRSVRRKCRISVTSSLTEGLPVVVPTNLRKAVFSTFGVGIVTGTAACATACGLSIQRGPILTCSMRLSLAQRIMQIQFRQTNDSVPLEKRI